MPILLISSFTLIMLLDEVVWAGVVYMIIARRLQEARVTQLVHRPEYP